MLRVILLALACSLAFGAAVGSITSPATFTLRGVSVPATAIPNWPVAIGDEITTGSEAAVLKFPDGSRVSLERNTTVSIESGSRGVRVRLKKGGLGYRIAADGKVEVAGLELKPIPSGFDSGFLTVANRAAYLSATSSPGAITPSGLVNINPFNQGYVNCLRTAQGCPAPPPQITDPNAGRIQSASNIAP